MVSQGHTQALHFFSMLSISDMPPLKLSQIALRRIRLVVAMVMVFTATSLTFAQDTSTGTYWVERNGNVPPDQHFSSAQAVCDARVALVFPGGSLLYFEDAGTDPLSGTCRYTPYANYMVMAYPVRTVVTCGGSMPVWDQTTLTCIAVPPPICPVGPSDAPPCQPNKNQGPQCNVSTKRPIHTSTGNKYWSDTDHRSASAGHLHFSHYYNSQNTAAVSTLGTAWRHNYDSSIKANLTINGTSAVLMARANGLAYAFTANGTTYTSQDADVTDKLTGLTDTSGTQTGYQYTVAADNSIETYNATGKLISIQDRAGMMQTLAYSDDTTPVVVAPKTGLLIRVTDAFGRQLNFTYDASSRIATLTDPAGGQYQYGYDANNNLASVTYPDTKVKGYLYNEPAYTGGNNLPNALTGMADENGVRYASYYYDAQGRAYKENQAGGVNQYQIGFSSDGSNSSITDPLGTTRTTSFTTILGVIKATGQSQPGGSGCGPASSGVTYDANGNVASRTDFNGTITQYTYDLTRNMETSRIEGLGTPQARTITTQWHATYRLPVATAEPLRKTTFNYDASGNLLTKTIQATNDATGAQGASAPAVGVARTWTYTYNAVGQVLTATGPRTDVLDRTTYAYDTQGNLITITNAAGHLTTLSNYDANGRAGRITDPNGITTDMSYSARGWLTSRVVSGAGGGAETTSYDYDGVGQMTKATMPDGSTIFYTYDPAHRLTAITDSLGNSMTYTLDAIGNRTNEQVKDPNGTLARQTSRIYDALNRLQQVTGGTQ
jgi:YD repeat-containing protein